jgi:hypothetical protein
VTGTSGSFDGTGNASITAAIAANSIENADINAGAAIDWTKLGISSTVSATEIGYVDGVTSAIQTQVDAKIAKTLTTTTGDIIYASSANTPARLGIGSSAQVLSVSGGVPAWTTPVSGSMTLLNSSTTNLAGLSGTTTFSSISGSYKNLFINIYGLNPSSGTAELVLRFNADSGTNYPREEYMFAAGASNPAFSSQNSTGFDLSSFGRSYLQQSANNFWNIQVPNYTRTGYRIVMLNDVQDLGNVRVANGVGGYKGSAAITSISLILTAGTYSTGTIEIYGVN